MKHASTERHPSTPSHFMDPPHEASRYESGNGHGTVRRWPSDKTLEHPVLDGATGSSEAEHDVENPWRGLSDPGLIVHPGHSRRPKWHWFWE